MVYKSNLEKANRTTESVNFPETILIDNCSACNLKCSMCDHKNLNQHRKIEIMDFKLYKCIIDEVAKENPSTRVWEVYFGEPCLCKDMPERISYAKKSGLTDVVVNTNGVLLTPERAEAFILSGLDAIYVGIDSVTEETYNKIRIGGNYHQTVNNVLRYKELLDQHGNKKQQLFVQFVVTEFNENELEQFKAFWYGHGVNVKIRPKVSWAGLVTAPNLHDNNQVERKPCYWLMRTLPICSNGSVALCAIDIHKPLDLGNVKEMSIKHIWNDKLKEVRHLHQEGNFDQLPKLCKYCRDWQSGYAEFIKSNEKASLINL